VGNQIVAAGLKPEITTGWEVGFDADLMDRRINAGLTWYSSSTVDQTVPTGVSITSGFSSFLRNTGEVSNKGLEALFHYTPIRGKDWTVTAGGNYTFNDNKVVSISSDIPRLQLSTGGAAQVYAVPGHGFPVLMGPDYVRDPQGRVIVDRISGYPTLDDSLIILGNSQPKHRLGLDLEIKFKALRLWVLAEYRGGYSIYHDMGSTMDFSGSSIRTVAFNRDRFVFPNSSYEDPSRPGTYIANSSVTVRDGGSGFFADGDGDYNMFVATNYVVKGDFWKIREISLSYDFPRSLLAKTKYIKGATISLQGRNLFLWTPKSNIYTDPEYNFSETNAIGVTTLGSSPPSRYYGATISLTF
jgi:outer membrane receptor protein involved in Fe transport